MRNTSSVISIDATLMLLVAQPASALANAVASPIPRPAPVTTATGGFLSVLFIGITGFREG